MQKHLITISDLDVIEMNDLTGDIVISAEHLPTAQLDDEITIQFKEDTDSIKHKYIVTKFNDETNNVYLKWIEQLTESLIVE